MASVFISHSSLDKEFVRRLAADLRAAGHEPWVDEDQINVGDCIVKEVERGLETTEYVALVLTKHAVESGWVASEWRTKFAHGIKARRPVILPVLLTECEIPTLLNTTKYANFEKSYEGGLAELLKALHGEKHAHHAELVAAPETHAVESDRHTLLLALLKRTHDKDASLTSVMVDALATSSALSLHQLRSFCEHELAGYRIEVADVERHNAPHYRLIEMACTLTGQANINDLAWGTDGNRIMQTMLQDTANFSRHKMVIPLPISEVEVKATKGGPEGVLTWQKTWRDIGHNPQNPDAPCWCYAHGNAFRDVLEGARTELTKLLVAALAQAKVV